jgi:undecaprenyl diphosphate synthase
MPVNEDMVDKDKLPVHIGIIMDGNGRWAKMKGKPRSFGHRAGLTAAKRVIKAASNLGIKFVSLYTFSTENWKRANEETSFLMLLLKTHLKKEYDFYRKNKIRVMHSGNLVGLPKEVIKEIKQVTKDTADFPGLTINLAINYGGRDEIIRSINTVLKEQKKKNMELNGFKFTEEIIKNNLDLPEFPDPDLIVRTGGEKRISNFLVWESAYSELYFSPVLWPDWDKNTLINAIIDYQKRDRRFGGVK